MNLKVGRGCPQPAAGLKEAPVDSGALRTTRPTSRWFRDSRREILLRKLSPALSSFLRQEERETARALFWFMAPLPALVLLIALGGCAGPRRAALPAPALTESSRAEIYGRANREFANALFFRPATVAATDPSALRFNPLIVQEAGEEPAGRRDYFGRIFSSAGRASVEPDHPTIYFRAGSVILNGRSHEQFTYVWFYPASTPVPEDSALPMQGVRITLDSAGRPVIWEILADTSGAQIIFVAESLEAAAAAEFGHSLPGRRHSIERAVREAPGSIVARVIADGPAPMGPIVYLRARTREVGTVTCRCMPDQAKKLVGQGEYELAVFPDNATEMFPSIARSSGEGAVGFLRGKSSAQSRLEQSLRLPSSF